MLTECKCGNPVEAKLDVETNQIICQSCGKEIENMSEFAKARMKQDGDIVRNDSLHKVPEGGMQIECNKCQKNIIALLNKKDDKAYCPKCGEKQKLSSYATALLRENGQYDGVANKEENPASFDLDLESEAGVGQSSTPEIKVGVVTIDENGGMPVVRPPMDEPEITLIPPTKTVPGEELPETAETAKAPKTKVIEAEVVTEKKKRGRPPKKKA